MARPFNDAEDVLDTLLLAGGDLASYSEVCKMLFNAERREREGKRRLALVREAMVQSTVTACNATTTRHMALEATRGRRAWRHRR